MTLIDCPKLLASSWKYSKNDMTCHCQQNYCQPCLQYAWHVYIMVLFLSGILYNYSIRLNCSAKNLEFYIKFIIMRRHHHNSTLLSWHKNCSHFAPFLRMTFFPWSYRLFACFATTRASKLQVHVPAIIFFLFKYRKIPLLMHFSRICWSDAI